MDYSSILSISSSVVSLIIGFFIIYKNSRNRINLSFAAFTFCVAIWIFTNFLADIARTPEQALLWARLTLVTPTLGPFCLLYFSRVFPIQTKPIRLFNWIILSIPAIIIILLVPTKFNIEKVTFTSSGQDTIVGPLYTPFAIYFISYFCASFFNIISSYKKLGGIYKNQIKYLFFGLTVFFLIALLTNAILPLAGFSSLVSFGPLAALIFLLSVSYAILKHRLLDIEIIIRRSVIYSLLLVSLVFLYSALVFALNRLFLPSGEVAFPKITDLFAIAIVAFTVEPLKRFLERTTDKVFFKARYNAEETISNLSEAISSIIDLDELLLAIKNTLSKSVRMSKFAVYLKTDHNLERVDIKDGFDAQLDEITKRKFFLTEILEKSPDLLVVDEVKRMIAEKKVNLDDDLIQSYEDLEQAGVAVVVTLISKDKVTGAIFLGRKLSDDLYSNEDLKLLEILGRQAAVAIENAKLYDEQKKFAGKLQIEVKKATTELTTANDRLKELDKAKDEFISVVSHELRTPMTAIKSYVWLVLNGRAGPLNAQMQNYLFKVYDSSERLIGMINDVLDVSHIETGRLNVELVPVSPVKVAQDVVETLKARADEQKIELVVDKDKAIPLISADVQKLNEVFTNLIGNALKFTKPGGNVTTSFQKNGDSIEISVADSGIGISKADLPKLFSKFGRLQKSYATMATSGGSGLGLYITKNYIELMKGKIWVNSTEGKGTTFTFSLPISSSQTAVETEATSLIPQGIIRKR